MKSKQYMFIASDEHVICDVGKFRFFHVLIRHNDIISVINGYISSYRIPCNDKRSPLSRRQRPMLRIDYQLVSN